MIQNNLIYPELSYKIIKASFNVFNELGWGHKEIYYQRAFLKELNELGLKSEKEKQFNLEYKGEIVGKYFVDFVVDDKIVIELKTMSLMGYVHINQVVSYLKQSNKKLAILIYFTKDGVKYRRIINNK